PGHPPSRPGNGRGQRRQFRAPARPWRNPGTRRRRCGARILRTDHACPGHPGCGPGRLPVENSMPRKILNTLIFALIAVVVAALGYWNLAPDSARVVQQSSDDNAVDFYVVAAHTVQFQDDEIGRASCRERV